jgi:hypothetical protein
MMAANGQHQLALAATACKRNSPVSTYRLVNVPVNPSGRFGAPETEPGPSGVGRLADELMTIPFTVLDGLSCRKLEWPLSGSDDATRLRAVHPPEGSIPGARSGPDRFAAGP